MSIYVTGLFSIKRGNIFISMGGKSFIMLESSKIDRVELKKDGTYFYEVFLKNGLNVTIDLG